jgi:regulator of replication initiation timing
MTDTHIHVHCCPDESLADRVAHLEGMIMTLTDDINALRTEFTAFVADVTALQAQVSNLQDLINNSDIPGATAAVAGLKADLDAAVTSVGDVNQDGTPAPAPAP